MNAKAWMQGDVELTLLLSREAIAARVRELAAQINRDYAGRALLLVGVLKGAFIFFADLVRELEVPVEVEFVRLTSYGMGAASTGQVRLTLDLERPIAGRDVLIVEDVLETGLTLRDLLQQLHARNPASLRVCVLLHKRGRAQFALTPDYVGFEVTDGFVVGYGIDYAERYRQLPDLHVLIPPMLPP